MTIQTRITTGKTSEIDLRRELQNTYEALAQITSRLLLANDAAAAALSTQDRTEASQRFLDVVTRGLDVRRAAVFLVEGEGFSVGAVAGLSEEDQEELAASEADIEACGQATASGEPYVLDDSLVLEEDGAAPPTVNGGELEVEEVAEEEETEQEGAEEDETEERESEGGAEPGAAFFGIYVPASLEDQPIVVLALGERGMGACYGGAELTFLSHVLGQLALALHRGTLLEQNAERLRELDALLRVSREITSTLDLDAVLRAVVNTVQAVVEHDRAEIVLSKGDRLVLRSVSGMVQLDPDQLELFKLGDVFRYLKLYPVRTQISADMLAGGERPAGADVFAEYFSSQEMRSFMAIPLRDDQGLLGFLCLESRRDSWDVEPAEGDALDILAAQTTVAIRNATLYSEIPLRGVSLPMAKVRARLSSLGAHGRVRLAIGVAAALLILFLPIIPERAGGSAELVPLEVRGARAFTDGVVARVLVNGGEQVRAGQPLAEIEDLSLAGRIDALQGEIEVARRAVAAASLNHDDASWRSGQIQLGVLERTLDLEQRRARGTVLLAPFAGQVLELSLGQRVGQYLPVGESFCTIAALDPMAADVQVDESKIGKVRVGQTVLLRVMAYPTRVFRGRVIEVGWSGRPDARGTIRFLVRARIDGPGHLLKPGMSGIGKAEVGRRSLGMLAIEPITRAIQMKWW